MDAYIINGMGVFTGEVIHLEDGDPIPLHAVTIPPPDVEPGKVAVFLSDSWVVSDPPILLEPEQRVARSFGRIITQLAFRNRFTPQEKATIDLASIHDATKPKNDPSNVLAATLRANAADLNASTYVQLDRPDLLPDLQQMETYGILAAGRALQIQSRDASSVELLTKDRLAFGLPEVPTNEELALNNRLGYLTPDEM